MRRPFLLLMIFTLLNMFLFLNEAIFALFSFNAIIISLLIIFKDKKIIILLIFSVILSFITTNYINQNIEVFNDNVVIEGKVIEYSIGENDKFILKIEYIDINEKKEKFKTKVLVNYDGDIEKLIGNNIILETKLMIPEKNSNPHMFSYKNYLASKGIYYISYIENENILKFKQNKVNFQKSIYNLRKKISYKFESIYSNKTLYFIKGFIYGDKSDFMNEDLEKFYNVGLGHILVVSGLHFGILYLILSKILSYINLSQINKAIIVYVFLFLMLMITGFKISAIRAYILIVIAESIFLFDRRIDILNLLSFLAILVIILNPYAIYSLSFILSFGAIFSISLFYDKFSEKLPKTIRLIISVQIILFLINIYVFNRINISSLLINIPTNFIVSLLYILILSNFLFYKLHFLTIFITKIIEMIFKMVDYFDEIDIFKITVRSFTFFEVFILLFVFLLIIYKKENKKIKNIHIVYFVLISVIVLNTSVILNEDLFINFYDVKAGDSSLVITPHKSKLLIDTGREDNYDLIGDILLKNGIKDIDIVVLTHNHNDHIGGMENLLLNHKIKYLILSNESVMNEDMQEIFNLLDEDVKVIYSKKGDNFEIDGVKFLVINPIDKTPLNENNESVVLDMNYNDKHVLFTGDIEKETEHRILGFINNDYDILKVCHHGSKTSSTKEFIEKVNPKYSIIQVGRNSYGHPHIETLETLEKVNSKIYRNDINGCITVKINENIKIDTVKLE